MADHIGPSFQTTKHEGREILISAVQFDDELKSGKRSLLDLAPIAAKFGVQGVEYRDVYWREKARELPVLREQVAKLGLKAAYAVLTPLYHADAEQQKQLLQDIEDAHMLGASLLRVNLGERGGDIPETSPLRYSTRVAVQRANGLRLNLSVENSTQRPGHLLEEIKQAMERITCRFTGTNMDFANYAVTGQDPMEAIKALGRRINYVHVKDAQKTAEGWKSTYLGNGTLPLKEIIAAIDATGKHPLFCFEFPGAGDPEGAIAKSLEFMAKLGG